MKHRNLETFLTLVGFGAIYALVIAAHIWQ
jgi:hypothetical protein